MLDDTARSLAISWPIWCWPCLNCSVLRTLLLQVCFETIGSSSRGSCVLVSSASSSSWVSETSSTPWEGSHDHGLKARSICCHRTIESTLAQIWSGSVESGDSAWSVEPNEACHVFDTTCDMMEFYKVVGVCGIDSFSDWQRRLRKSADCLSRIHLAKFACVQLPICPSIYGRDDEVISDERMQQRILFDTLRVQ